MRITTRFGLLCFVFLASCSPGPSDTTLKDSISRWLPTSGFQEYSVNLFPETGPQAAWLKQHGIVENTTIEGLVSPPRVTSGHPKFRMVSRDNTGSMCDAGCVVVGKYASSTILSVGPIFKDCNRTLVKARVAVKLSLFAGAKGLPVPASDAKKIYTLVFDKEDGSWPVAGLAQSSGNVDCSGLG